MTQAAQERGRLFLLRHAEAGSGAPGLDDHDRPLTARGREAAGRVGAYMASRGYTPTHVICSSALRTRETWESVSERLPGAPRFLVMQELYLASPGQLLDCIAQAPAEAESLLVIAHNPGIAALASALAEGAPLARVAALRHMFSTASLAVYDVAPQGWTDLAARLVDYVQPERLPESEPG